MPRPKVSDEVKAAALADLANGEQPVLVAQRYGIPDGTVRQWKNRLDLPVTENVTRNVTTGVTIIRRPSIEEHQTRILELMYRNLAAKLAASERIAEHVTDPNWLYRQDAAGIAALGQYLDATALNTLALLAGRPTDDRSSE
jgi:transposase-like protein